MPLRYIQADQPDIELLATSERRQHAAEIVTTNGVQQVLGALASLQRTGEISDCHVEAANRWYRDWIMGIEGAHDPFSERSGKAPDAHVRMLSRVAACGRCSDVRRSLGQRAEDRLRLILLEELSFSEIGRRLLPGDGNARRKIAAQTVLLLEMLADHYASRDRVGRGATAPHVVEPEHSA